MVTEYSGSSARYDDISGNYFIDYTLCPELLNCKSNRQDIREADMTPLNKGSYFQMFLKTVTVMHIPQKDGMLKEARIEIKDTSITQPEVLLDSVYKTLDKLDLSGIDSTVFANKVIINSTNLKIRDNEVVIPSVLRVSKKTVPGTRQEVIDEITYQVSEDDKYVFYQLDDICIQTAKGVNLPDYIKIK